jgi:hypothetical protein
VTEQQEIAAMRLAVGEPLPPSISSPSGTTPASSDDTHAHPVRYQRRPLR